MSHATRLARYTFPRSGSLTTYLSIHPGDVLLTEYYKGDCDECSSLLESLRSVLRKRGVAGLFVGLQARPNHYPNPNPNPAGTGR